jgi:hypothetical protein
MKSQNIIDQLQTYEHIEEVTEPDELCSERGSLSQNSPDDVKSSSGTQSVKTKKLSRSQTPQSAEITPSENASPLVPKKLVSINVEKTDSKVSSKSSGE